MKTDPDWVLVSGFVVLGTLAVVVVSSAAFLFFSGYHSGSTQCPKPALMK